MPAMSLLAAITCVSMGGTGPGYHHQNLVQERLLATAPPCATPNGVVWHEHANARACHYGRLGPDKYGAPEHLRDELVYVRVDHTVIAISPWERFNEQGHQSLERARNQWLREQGLVGGVRTHINPAYHSRTQASDVAASETTKDIEPRAIIHIRDRTPARTGPLRAQAQPAKPFFRVLPPNNALAQAEETNPAG